MTSVTLAFLGDVMLGRMVSEEIRGRSPESFWGDVLPVLGSADAVFANLECAITTHGEAWSRTPKVFHFGACPEAVEVLRVANIRYVSLANNHILDFQEQGLLDTLEHLDAAGIAHAGAGRTLEDAMAPALVQVGGLKIGVISLTDNEPAFAATAERPGTYYAEICERPDTLAPIKRRIADLRDAGAQEIVLSVHWGPNMVESPRARFRGFAHAVVDLGADLFHGHSAHLCQGVEVRDRGLILYDCGDFLDDYAVDPVLRNDWSFVFLLTLGPDGPRRLKMLPVRLRFARVDLACGQEFKAIVRRMQRLCAAFGTPATPTDEGLEIDIQT